MRSLPSGPWEVLFERALRLVDDIQRHGGLSDPFWTFGGGTVLIDSSRNLVQGLAGTKPCLP